MANKNDLIQSNPNGINADADYRAWIKDLSQRYRQSQVIAACGINAEQLRYYWSVGRDIIEMHIEERWGQGVIKQLSNDLTCTLDRKGFSVTSLGYIKRFYLLYPEAVRNLPPVGDEITETLQNNLPSAGGEKINYIASLPGTATAYRPNRDLTAYICRQKPASTNCAEPFCTISSSHRAICAEPFCTNA